MREGRNVARCLCGLNVMPHPVLRCGGAGAAAATRPPPRRAGQCMVGSPARRSGHAQSGGRLACNVRGAAACPRKRGPPGEGGEEHREGELLQHGIADVLRNTKEGLAAADLLALSTLHGNYC